MSGTIYTYGYLSGTPAQLADLVAAHNALLIDIRYNPTSRDARWRTSGLVRLLGRDRYRQCWPLGNINYRTGGPIELADPTRGVAAVAPLLRSGNAVILLCACREVARCHRRVAAEVLAEATGAPVVHLPVHQPALL